MADVFLSGGTGYLGRALIPKLLERGHPTRTIVRPQSTGKVPAGCRTVVADVLDAASFRSAIAPADTFIHLTGTPKPAPWKEREFRTLDGPSLHASVDAAAQSGSVRHFIYVSVAHPAPVMRAYIAVRQECEDYLALHCPVRTVLRPWYVLGPGHWWPYALKPLYALAGKRWERLGLVTLDEMTRALVEAVETRPAAGAGRIVDVPTIRFPAARV